MKTRYYLLHPDNRITILITADGDNPDTVIDAFINPLNARILTDSDLYKLIAQATEALNTKPY
jgi:hypothetical protein